MNQYQLFDCACPTDCVENELPSVEVADCPAEVILEESEIQEVYLDDIVRNEQSGEEEFANLPAEVTGAEPGWYGDAVKINTIGDLPPSEDTPRRIHKGWVKYGVSTWTLNIDIMEASESMYNLIRWMQCNKGKLVGAAWKTMGGYIYGTAKASIASANWNLDRGEEGVAIGQIVLEIKADCLPPRELDPELAPAA